MSVGQSARHRASSSAGQNVLRSTTPLSGTGALTESDTEFRPCASTASIFLFSQGSKILCLHHDTLAVHRRFEKHKQPVTLLSVDNVSERGAGRLVVSYDKEQTAMVWDLFTGDEITRFASFKPLTAAAWMKNGNIAFGDSEGSVMLFEPSTSEHQARRTIFDPITAIAPASDCQTYAIGYQNGSVLIASLLPNFTILHTLSTPRKPSPIVGLAWHASSSKQKSDMLAVQCADGDLRVWSIAKPAVAEVPKTIRILERGDLGKPGGHWISWSKNGRILQYSQGETWAWDVRTKHVAYEPIPTVDGVQSLANFGPGAALFTIGPNDSVQQYDTSPPALVKNVSHDPRHPVSAQSTPKINAHTIPGAAPPLPLYKAIDPPQNAASLSTIQRATTEMSAADHARQVRRDMGSPLSATSRTESISSRGSGYRDYRTPSIAPSGTTFSTMSPSLHLRDSTQSPFWPATASVASSSRRSKGSRLRNEVMHSPEGNIIDLFPYTRARLASLPYAPQPAALDQNTATAEELRQQMLEIVFGWSGDIEPMIRDELNRHPVGSMNATLLSKWLGEVNPEMISSFPSDSVSSSDWMLLALSAMNGNGAAGQQMARTFASRLLTQGDIHTAATILMGVKDFDEAVDIYVSRNYYMEAILLTCLLFPSEWQRQSHLVRRWGEYVVENSQQHLAIRCFTCTGTDASVPWATPTQSPFQGSQPPSLPQTLSPPTSPPAQAELKPTRMTVKDSSLKLITTFGGGPEKNGFKFPGLKTDDRTPTNAPGVTPIAESALSPSGTPSSYLRPAGRARSIGGQNRNRLSSIGETPIDVNPPIFPIERPQPLPTPDNSGSDAERETKAAQDQSDEPKMIEDPPLTLSSARYDPQEEGTPNATPQTAIPGSAQKTSMLSKSDINALNTAQERSRTRNGSRDRKPTGLHIHMPSLSQLNLNAIATGTSGDSPRHERRRSNASGSLHSSSASNKFDPRHNELSPPITGQSWASSTKSPSVSGRSIDPYISSLEEAKIYAKQKKEKTGRHHSRESTGEKKSRSKTRQREPSESRGRTGQRYIRPAKRSPSSPVPMSPEDLEKYRQGNTPSIDSVASRDSSPEDGPRPQSHKRKGMSKHRSASKYSEQSQRTTVRHESPNRQRELDYRTGRSRGASRKQSPNGYLSPIDGRGRSKSRGAGAAVRSPSSPLPMSSQAALYKYEDEELEEDPMRLVEANRQRVRSRQRSTSRKPQERTLSRPRDRSASRRRMMEEEAMPAAPVQAIYKRDSPKSSDAEKGGSDSNIPRLLRNKSHRSLKREAAARELEARRESLNLRTMVSTNKTPNIYQRPALGSRSQSDLSGFGTTSPSNWRSPDSLSGFSEGDATSGAFSPPERTPSAGPYGLPATPRAMRHPRYGSRDEGAPAVPQVPDQFYATGHPINEPHRAASAPVPEPDMSIPPDIPLHPAFQHHLPRSAKKLPPLNDIGRHRRGSSIDKTISPPMMGSIGEALEHVDGEPIIDVPITSHTPPAVIPELQHLASPPPPPPPPVPFKNDPAHHSLSSGSGVGTINIVMDDVTPNATPVPDAPPVKKSSKEKVASPPLPPIPSPAKSGDLPQSATSMGSGYNPAQSPELNNGSVDSGKGHRRGRSIDHIGSKFTRMADRMRSTSRGRNVAAAREARSPLQTAGPVPYETKLPSGYF